MNDNNNDNGELNPDNPQVPKAEVVQGIDWVTKTRQRLANEEAGVKETDEDGKKLPKPKTFQIEIKNSAGEPIGSLIHTGFLIASSSFVGVSDVEGIIQGIFPLDSVLFATAIDPDKILARTPPQDEPPQAA